MLTKAKCPACGGALELNPGLERGICVYCGGEFLVQEAIQKFKAEIDGLPTLKNMLIRAEQKLSDGDRDGAEKLYEDILKGAPTCHEAWWGKFRSLLETGDIPRGLVDCKRKVISLITKCSIEGAEKELKDIVSALDRVDLQYLLGNNSTNALRAIEYAPEELKGVYQQKLDQILKYYKKISEDMKELIAETMKNMLLRAEQKLSDGDRDDAMELYEDILKDVPTCHEAWWGKFRSLLETGDVPRGLVDCQHKVISLIKKRSIENAKKELKNIVSALDRVDLQYLFGNNITNALRAIECAPEGLKGVYQQKLDQILKDCKKNSEDMKKLLAAREEELWEVKVTFLIAIVFGAILGGITGYFWTGVIFGFILGFIWKVIQEGQNKRRSSDSTTTDVSLSS